MAVSSFNIFALNWELERIAAFIKKDGKEPRELLEKLRYRNF